MRRSGWVGREALLAAVLLAWFVLGAGWALLRDASVADEHPHILSGVLYWKSHQFSGGLDNPPLGQLWIAAPLVLLHRPYVYASDAGLALCRLPVLGLGVGLGLLLWRWGRALGGRAAGLATLGAYVLEPNLLAHAHLATVDFPVTALWTATLWAWWRLFVTPQPSAARRRGSIALFACLAAVAALTKFTGLLALPAVWITVLVSRRDAASLRRATLAVGIALVACVALAVVAYGFEPLHFGLPQKLAEGLQGKLAHRNEVRFAYLAGQRSESGFLSYYLIAMLLKTPLPLLGLAGWGAWVTWRRHARFELALLVIPAAIVVIAFTLIRVNVGVRHVLPVYPALCLLAGLGASQLVIAGRAQRITLAVLGSVWVLGVVHAAPHWLAYFNVAAGGPASGSRWLLDSNLAWGQDDARLATFVQREAEQGRPVAIDPNPAQPHVGRFVVGVNALHDLQRRTGATHAWLRPLPARDFPAGWSYLLYELEEADFIRQETRTPQDPIAAWAHAEVVRAGGEPLRAESVLNAALGRLARPEDRASLVNHATRAALDRWDLASAAYWVRIGLEMQPPNPDAPECAAQLQLAEQSRGAGAESTAASLASRADAALELGLQLADRGDVAAALPLLRQAAQARPHDLPTQRALAVAFAHMGNYEAALDILDRPEIAPHCEDEQALCQALAATEAAVQHGSNDVDPELLLELGRTHFEAERYGPATAAFARLLALRPDDRLALAYLGEMQVRVKMNIVSPEVRVPPFRVDVLRRATRR